MSMDSDLRRLGAILERLTGDKALRDEAKAIVRRLSDTPPSTVDWWDTFGPNRPLSPTNRAIIDFVVVNGQATKQELAAHLNTDEENAYRYVSRADEQLLERGGKATISWDGRGVARTAATSIVVSNFPPRSR